MKVSFNLENNEIYKVEITTKKEICGTDGVDNWKFYADFRRLHGFEYETYLRMRELKRKMKKPNGSTNKNLKPKRFTKKIKNVIKKIKNVIKNIKKSFEPQCDWYCDCDNCWK